MDYEKEISFGAFDSELMHQEIYIPEGFEATIDGDKIILTRKDSEDERIRKELIGYIVKEVGLYPGEDRKEHKWLRWLEKQGEHKKFRDSIQVGDEVTRNSDGVIVNLSQLNRVAKKDEKQSETFTKKDVDDAYVGGMAFAKNELEKQGEQKPIDKIQLGKKYKCIASPRYSTFRRGNIYKPVDNFLCNLMNLCYECFEPIEDSEQKPTDEDMKEALRTEYEKGRADTIAQMQKEWSEEDEKIRQNLMSLLSDMRGHRIEESTYQKYYHWLKSLKERYFWKPKEWEIQILESVIEKGENPKNYSATLHSILEQLRKLKGE